MPCRSNCPTLAKEHNPGVLARGERPSARPPRAGARARRQSRTHLHFPYMSKNGERVIRQLTRDGSKTGRRREGLQWSANVWPSRGRGPVATGEVDKVATACSVSTQYHGRTRVLLSAVRLTRRRTELLGAGTVLVFSTVDSRTVWRSSLTGTQLLLSTVFYRRRRAQCCCRLHDRVRLVCCRGGRGGHPRHGPVAGDRQSVRSG